MHFLKPPTVPRRVERFKTYLRYFHLLGPVVVIVSNQMHTFYVELTPWEIEPINLYKKNVIFVLDFENYFGIVNQNTSFKLSKLVDHL